MAAGIPCSRNVSSLSRKYMDQSCCICGNWLAQRSSDRARELPDLSGPLCRARQCFSSHHLGDISSPVSAVSLLFDNSLRGNSTRLWRLRASQESQTSHLASERSADSTILY